MKIQRFFTKKNLVIGTLVLSVFTTFMFSLQLQKPQLLSTSSHAMELPQVNIPPINIPTIHIRQPVVIIPTLAPIQVPVVSSPQIQIPAVPTVSGIPDLGSYFSQGASLIQQILANPNAKQIIAIFLGNILSGSKSTPSVPLSPATPSSPTDTPQQPTPTSAPQIVLQTCKEGDGTKTNTCPVRYPEGDKFVYRQCGATGWCSYTCFKPNTQEVIPCWDGIKQKIMTACNKLPCTCSDKEKRAIKSCPVLYPENGIEKFRGCDVSKGGVIGDDSMQWCNYTCFDPGTDNVVDCWSGQHTWVTPTPGPQNQPTIPAGQNTTPTNMPVNEGSCLAKPPAMAGVVGCSTASYKIANGVTSACSSCAGVNAKATCTCPSGTCECDIPASKPPTTTNCSNGGRLQVDLCQ